MSNTPKWLTDNIDSDSAASENLAEYNDQCDISERTREKAIIAGFAKQGIEVKFVP